MIKYFINNNFELLFQHDSMNLSFTQYKHQTKALIIIKDFNPRSIQLNGVVCKFINLSNVNFEQIELKM